MPITNALYSGVSGLSTNSDGMAVIANNIANANTRSFKCDRAEFEDLLAITLNENSQLGRGARLRNIQTSFNQGAMSNTGAITDLGIQGDGFFVVKNDLAEVKESNGMFYTRQGSFRFDKNGKITDPSGNRLQGYMQEEDGTLSTKLSDVEISTNNIPPRATSIVNLVLNLDVREKAPVDNFDLARPKQTSNFATSVTLYDNYGIDHEATIYCVRDPNQDENSWTYHVTVDSSEITTEPELDEKGRPKPAEIYTGKVAFDVNGNPVLNFLNKNGKKTQIDTINQSDAVDVKFINGASPQKIQFNFGPTIDETGRVDMQASTSIAARNGLSFHEQDGYEAGYLKTIRIELDGSLKGVYTNGLERKIASIALAAFPNNHGLEKVGRNNFISTPKAGEARIGLPQSGSRGSIYSASLEESNVDLAQQFVDMITTQRGFQANSKSITTTDTLLEEIISLKR